MRRRKSSDEGLIVLALVLGIPIFLLMVYPIIFWLVFLPLAVILIMRFIGWLKK
jgi:hypothetical protein